MNSKVMERGRAEGTGVSLALTSSRHIPAQAMTAPTTDLLYRIPDQPSLDGNTVDMDRSAHSLPITACNTRQA